MTVQFRVSGHNGKYVIFGFEARLSWGKSLNLLESQFAHLQNGPDDNVGGGINVNIFSMYLIASICPVQCCPLCN